MSEPITKPRVSAAAKIVLVLAAAAVLLAVFALAAPGSKFFFPLVSLWCNLALFACVLLVLRDMAKVFFRGRSFLKAEQPAEEKNPQKEKVERYAASFRKLADSFYGLPYRKDYLSNGQVDGIIRETCDEICSHCYQREICWGTQSQEMYRGSERMIRSMEEGNQEKIQETKSDWMSVCSRFSQYYETLGNSYIRERQKLIWDNRMI